MWCENGCVFHCQGVVGFMEYLSAPAFSAHSFRPRGRMLHLSAASSLSPRAEINWRRVVRTAPDGSQEFVDQDAAILLAFDNKGTGPIQALEPILTHLHPVNPPFSPWKPCSCSCLPDTVPLETLLK